MTDDDVTETREAGPGSVGSQERMRCLQLLSTWLDGLTMNELAAFTGFNRRDLSVALQCLRHVRRVECHGRGPGAVWRLLLPDSHRRALQLARGLAGAAATAESAASAGAAFTGAAPTTDREASTAST